MTSIFIDAEAVIKACGMKLGQWQCKCGGRRAILNEQMMQQPYDALMFFCDDCGLVSQHIPSVLLGVNWTEIAKPKIKEPT